MEIGKEEHIVTGVLPEVESRTPVKRSDPSSPQPTPEDQQQADGDRAAGAEQAGAGGSGGLR